MFKLLQHARERIRQAWFSIQVEYHGSYSVDRIRKLGDYMENLNSRRLLLVCVLTPLPCMILSLLKEIPPLAPASAGVYKNGVFFVRAWGVMCFMGVSALVQMGHGAPRLKMTNRQIVFVAVLAATVSIIVIFGLCVLTVFPLPFGLLIAGPPFVVVIAACFTYISGPQWRVDPSILEDVKRQLVVYNCQTTLPFVYPLYIFGFVSLTGWNQVVFVAILPIIQIFAKNWISRALSDDHDQKPQCVVFVVEVYNALYVSHILQTATSWTSTAVIMAVDLLQFWVSMVDVVELLDEVNILMAKIPRNHHLAKENFVQIAIRLAKLDAHQIGDSPREISELPKIIEDEEPATLRDASGTAHQSNSKSWIRKWVNLQRARVFPSQAPTKNEINTHLGPRETKLLANAGLEKILSPEERAMFIRKSTHVLFITEYLVLVEYVEVVLPFVYCLHQLILFHMHNRAYYPTLAGLSSHQFTSRILSTLLYSLFEFVSFVMLVVVLKRKLGYSSLQQLAFVLDTQAGVVQTKLNLIFVYIMQVSLVHHGKFVGNCTERPSLSGMIHLGTAYDSVGADFSFKFSWLHAHNVTSSA